MSFARKAAKSGLWFAGFRLIIQSFSWIVTIAIARILSPADYGLMAMASILTGYVEIFSELGLGAAIIQKKEIDQKELSSIFWFCMIVGSLFAVVSIGLAYPTAWIFNEPRVIPITQLISVLFIISAVMIVPYNTLTRDIRFKEIGMIQFAAVAVASLSMLWMARSGFGVWTLINGTIIQRTVNVVLTLLISKWIPTFHFRFAETKPLLKFGLNIAGSRSLFYLFQKSDKFVVGKMFNSQFLGYYSFAMQLASIPTDKIVSIVNQVSFPVFSRYQDDNDKCADMYLKINKYTTMIVAPLFLGGAFFAGDIIPVLLGEKWVPIIFIFQMFCLAQFIVSVTAINSVIHNAQDRSKLVMFFNFINTLLMPFSLFIAAKYGFNALAIPWITIYPLVCMWWTWLTLRKLNISVIMYIRHFSMPIIATIAMIIGVKTVSLLMNKVQLFPINIKLALTQEIVVGCVIYLLYLLFLEKKSLADIWNLRKS